MRIKDFIRLGKELGLTDLDKLDLNNTPPIKNRTRAYINPILRYHGYEFVKKINKMDFFASALYDADREKIPNTITRLVNAKHGLDLSLPYLVDHYYFGELIYGPLHALVIEIPKEFYGCLEHFEKGEYSKMYKNPDMVFSMPDSNVKSYFNQTKINVKNVCNKNPKYKKEIEDYFGVTVPYNNELDEKPNLYLEILNYK